MAQVISTVSAETYDTPQAFLDNISNLKSGSEVTINHGEADVTQNNYTINASNIIIKANGNVTFKSIIDDGFFYIDATNVTLIGINFINFRGTGNDSIDSGAIYIHDGAHDCKIINCKFDNCSNICNKTDFSGGGAIFTHYANNVNITNCIFNNCRSSGDGGAIFAFASRNMTITNCTFRNCAGDENGSAICFYTSHVGALMNCTFINCTNKGHFSGGVICMIISKQKDIKECKFINCTSEGECGGIFSISSNDVNVLNCTFNNCTAHGKLSSGAIFFDNTTNLVIYGCNFDYCISYGTNSSSGAIYSSRINTGFVISCTFNNCISNNNSGGAIHWSDVNGSISYSTFNNCKNNNASGGGGSICYSYGNILIENCKFENSTGTGSGGAIYISKKSSKTTATIVNCKLINCKINGSHDGDGGGAIILTGGSNGNITNCTFINCSAPNTLGGGAIIIFSSANPIINCNNFINCTSDNGEGGAILFLWSTNGKVLNSNFTNCSAKTGAAITLDIYGSFKSNGTLVNNNFNNCLADMGNGAIIYINKGELNITGGNGGLIYNNGTIISPVIAEILENKTINVINASTVRLSASLKTGNYTIIGQNFDFIINETKIKGEINGTEYIADYEVNGDVGDKIIVSGKYYNASTSRCKNGILAIKNPIEIDVDDVTIQYNQTKVVNINITSNGVNVQNGTVNITIDNTSYSYNCTVSGGTASFTLPTLDVEVYTATAFYYENDDYIFNRTTFTITVNRKSTKLDIDINDTVYGEKIEANVKVEDIGATGNVTLEVNGTVIDTLNLDDGSVKFNIPLLSAGIYNVTARYSGDEKYNSTVKSVTFKIIKANATFNINDITYGDDTIIINVNLDATGNVTVTITGKDYNQTIKDGRIIIQNPGLDVNEYNATINYSGNENYNKSTSTDKFSVKIVNTELTMDTEESYDSAIISLNLTTINKKPVNGTVLVNITGPNGYIKTEEVSIVNGIGTLSLTDLDVGNYNVNAIFTATHNYNGTQCEGSFLINHTTTGYHLNGTNVVKYFENGTQYHVTLTDNYGNPVANKNITVTLNCYRWSNLQYNITTNASGVATLTINLIAGFYTITATFGNVTPANNNITVKPVTYILKANDVIKYFENGTHYYVTVTDQSGNIVANKTITVVINRDTWMNPKVYHIVTNESGVAKLAIHLLAGAYTIIAKLDENFTYNNIAVFPTLTAENIVKKVSQPDSLEAKLVNGNGVPVAGKTVTFKVKDKVYTLTTNSEGIASLPINLRVGNWSILITDPETSAYTWAKVKVIK